MKKMALPVVCGLLATMTGLLWVATFVAPPAHWGMILANGGL